MRFFFNYFPLPLRAITIESQGLEMFIRQKQSFLAETHLITDPESLKLHLSDVSKGKDGFQWVK